MGFNILLPNLTHKSIFIMKCYFLIPLLFFFGAISFSAFGDNKNGKDNEESIYIVISDQITPEIDRSVHLYVSASINRHMKVIEVNHYGVGNGNIYIIDSNNTLIQLSSFIDTSCCTNIL